MKELIMKHKKVIAVVLVLCIYFALLSLISFVRASGEYNATGENIVSYEDFVVEAGDGRAWMDATGLHFSDTESTVKVFSAMISLEKFQQIQVEFFVECPQEYTGAAVLHVDLCADEYDMDAQEFVVELKAGRNKITQVIDKGDSAPEEARFRFFCLDSVKCDISDLSVQKMEEAAHSGTGPCIAVVVLVILLLAVILIGRKQKADNPKTEGIRSQKITPFVQKNLIKQSGRDKEHSEIKCPQYLHYWVIGISSVLIFILIYGMQVLDPTYVDWLLSGGDLSQHYLGWRGYRNSAWHFPIGMMDTLVYPNVTSIIFTDSIPLFAVPFKLLSPILPADFQYFGLWGVMSFLLQGLLAARILKHYMENKVALVLSSILFVLTPVMIMRMYAHTALAGHWILLLGLEAIFAPKKYHGNRKLYCLAALMGLLSASVHIYFVLMSGIILVGICFSNLLYYKEVKKGICILAEYIATVALVVGLLGGFSSGFQGSAGGLGHYSFNLNAFFNPQGWSDIYKDLPAYTAGQYEGFAYLGAGVIFCLLFAVLSFLCSNHIKRWLSMYWKSFAALFGTGIVAAVVAVSPTVSLGDTLLAEIKLPDIVTKLWSVFRASGRIIWIAVYIVMLTSCIVMYKTWSRKGVVLATVFAFALQGYDLHTALYNKNVSFNKRVVYESILRDEEFWKNIGNQGLLHVVYMSPVDLEAIFPFTDWAMDNQMTLSSFYLARTSLSFERKSDLSTDELYIFTEKDRLRCRNYDLNYYQADEFIVGSVNTIPGMDAWEVDMQETEKMIWQPENGQYLNNGEDTSNGRVLHYNGISYGPYWSVPAGNYDILIEGETLSDTANVDIHSQYGAVHHDFDIVRQSNSEIRIQLSLSDDVENLEIAVSNHSEKDILLRSVGIRYAE